MTARQELALQQHPLSALWPSMPEADFAALVDDIKEHGQHDAGVMFEGQVLDGWHRFKACQILGLDFKSIEYAGDDPGKFVISKNGRRRHASASIVAVATAACLEWRPRGGDQTAPGAVRSGTTLKEAAAAVGVGERTMERAKAVVQAGLTEEVQDGTLSLKEAEQVAKLPKAKRAKAVKDAKEGRPPKAPKEAKPKADVEKLHVRISVLETQLTETKESLGEMTDLAASAKVFEDKAEFNEMKVLRLELRSCKRRRDELMRENDQLKTEVKRWRKKAEAK